MDGLRQVLPRLLTDVSAEDRAFFTGLLGAAVYLPKFSDSPAVVPVGVVTDEKGHQQAWRYLGKRWPARSLLRWARVLDGSFLYDLLLAQVSAIEVDAHVAGQQVLARDAVRMLGGLVPFSERGLLVALGAGSRFPARV